MRFDNVDETVTLNYEAGAWIGGAGFEDPASGTVIADTGQLAEGIYDFLFTVWGQAAGHFYIEHRNAGNTASLAIMTTQITANNLFVAFHMYGLKVATDERVRISTAGAFVGWFAANVQYVKRV